MLVVACFFLMDYLGLGHR